MKRIGLFFIALFIGKISFALPGYWDTGFGQGISEYTLENNDGIKIAISCNSGGSDYMDHGVDVYIKGHEDPIVSDSEEYPPIEFLIDGDTYYAPYETRTRSGSNEWYRLTDALSKASSFTFFWGGEFFGDFESKNTSKTIAYLKDCKAMADRDVDYEPDVSQNNFNDYYALDNPSSNTRERSTSTKERNNAPMPANPFKITTQYADPFGYGMGAHYRVHITSLDDSILLNKVVINRGNCSVVRYDSAMPVRLTYSRSTYVVVAATCDILEVSLFTNKGDITYSF